MDRESVLTPPPYLGHLLLAIARVLRDRTREALAPLGLNPSHIGVISVLRSQPGVSQRELGRVLQTDRTTMVRLVDELAAMGVVSREASEDRRRNALQLTDAGKEMFRRMDHQVMMEERQLLRSLTQLERVTLKSLLRRVHDSLRPFEEWVE